MAATLISDLLATSNSNSTINDETFWSRLNEVKFIHGYIASFSVIIVSELGDKTFFIAAIMAMRHSRLKVFAAAMFAIFIMNTLAVLMGMATTVIPPVVIKYASSGLFLIFAIKMFYEGCNMTDEDSKEEMEEVQKAINKKELAASIDYERS
ncbi:transmembrane protein 165-like protein [Euroglyphus maynei]|uniref:GDT1 family protein n=1 Tax=Euroglyphus maynei TaxID=6958 RepID=A0A1Y3BEJ8_EURMA|nr:transmembrane protein 165-like protein [Euroglyphus maynei]